MTEAERFTRGLAGVEAVYGPGSSAPMQGLEDVPFVAETVSRMFGEVWPMPALSMRDKRLLVLGATAMLGRQDLVETQIGGALQNNELTRAQLDEITLLLLFYAGAGRVTALHAGIQAALAKAGL